MDDQPFAVTHIERKRVCKTSWWLDTPRAGFTKEAAAHQFDELPPREKPSGRIRTIGEEIEAFGPMQ